MERVAHEANCACAECKAPRKSAGRVKKVLVESLYRAISGMVGDAIAAQRALERKMFEEAEAAIMQLRTDLRKIEEMRVEVMSQAFGRKFRIRVRCGHLPGQVVEWMQKNAPIDRVGGDCECGWCGEPYYDHPEVAPTIHLLCDGRFGKT